MSIAQEHDHRFEPKYNLFETFALQIEVKVKENWRQNEGLLKYYGYGGQIQAL